MDFIIATVNLGSVSVSMLTPECQELWVGILFQLLYFQCPSPLTENGRYVLEPLLYIYCSVKEPGVSMGMAFAIYILSSMENCEPAQNCQAHVGMYIYI